jgi:hypothetical protein
MRSAIQNRGSNLVFLKAQTIWMKMNFAEQLLLSNGA